MGSRPRVEEALQGCTAQGLSACLYPPRFGETQRGESIAADGSARDLLGAGDGWTRGFNPWDPAAQASSCPAVYRHASSAAPHPSGKSVFPSSSLGNGRIHSQVPLRGFNPLLPYLAVGH